MLINQSNLNFPNPTQLNKHRYSLRSQEHRDKVDLPVFLILTNQNKKRSGERYAATTCDGYRTFRRKVLAIKQKGRKMTMKSVSEQKFGFKLPNYLLSFQQKKRHIIKPNSFVLLFMKSKQVCFLYKQHYFFFCIYCT